ncbi:BnaA02g34540D [Brassica napus]|uniref:Uncharacterized protein n=2 Tax=Brassica TaxID=3705 RepID=M4ESV5_BRACM|nr:unnamed protein product [Brassica napus]CDY31287.1 BnaA02g34540D [Brassica napus]
MAIRRRSGVQALQTRREGSLMVPRPVMSSGGARRGHASTTCRTCGNPNLLCSGFVMDRMY